MKLDGNARKLSRTLSEALNEAIRTSSAVADAVEEMRRSGYEPNISIRLQIDEASLVQDEVEDVEEDAFTAEDVRLLQRMRITP